MDVQSYNEKRRKRAFELEMHPPEDVDLLNLERMLLEISPYSLAWRCGYVKTLKRAMKLVEKENNDEKKSYP